MTKIPVLTARDVIRGVNYRILKGAACDYAKSRVASGGLTKPP
jgi:hypothetical protein